MQKIFPLQSAILFYFEYFRRFKEITEFFLKWMFHAVLCVVIFTGLNSHLH